MGAYMKGACFALLVLLMLCYKEHVWKVLIVERSITVNIQNIQVNLPEKASSKYIGAYYWAGVPLQPEQLNATLLTHLYYAFLHANDDGSLTIQDKKGVASALLRLKKVNPRLKLLFSVVTKGNSLSIVAASAALRQKFVQNACAIVKQYQYDGLDFDWEFPKSSDRENFVNLLKEVKTDFKKYGYLLTAAVQAIPSVGYNVPELAKYLDIINIMTYDYFGGWSIVTGENSPLYPSSLDTAFQRQYLNIKASVTNWAKAGAPIASMAIGLPFYGRTFILKDPAQHGIHAPSKGAGRPSAVTYFQILERYQNYTTVWNAEQASNYKYSGTTWLAYDDERSIGIKAKFAVDSSLAGVFVWSIGGDDVNGQYSSRRQPLMQTIHDVFV